MGEANDKCLSEEAELTAFRENGDKAMPIDPESPLMNNRYKYFRHGGM